MEPVKALERIVFLSERSLTPAYRVRAAFRTAARALSDLPADEVARRTAARTLESLKGIGPRTAQVVRETPDGQVPGCARPEECGVSPDRVATTWLVTELLEWTRKRTMPGSTAGTPGPPARTLTWSALQFVPCRA